MVVPAEDDMGVAEEDGALGVSEEVGVAVPEEPGADMKVKTGPL